MEETAARLGQAGKRRVTERDEIKEAQFGYEVLIRFLNSRNLRKFLVFKYKCWVIFFGKYRDF